MIRLLNAYFPTRTLFLGVSESILAALAFLVAMVAYLGPLNALIALNYENGGMKIALIVSTFVVCMYYFDLYDSVVLSNRREVLTRIFLVMGSLCLILAGVYYAFPFLRLGGAIVVSGTVLASCELVAWRRLFLFLNTLERFAEPCIILGDGQLADILVSEIAGRAELGIRVVSQISEDHQIAQRGFQSASFSEELAKIVERYRAKRIIVALGERRGKLPVELLLHLKSMGVRIQDGVEVHEAITGRIAPDSLCLSWLLFSPGFQVSWPQLACKRFLGLLFSSLGLLLAFPLLLAIAIAIRLDSAGPIIFRQQRVGKKGKIFTLYKFRSMFHGVDPDGNFKPATKGDPRITHAGRWLRAMRLDELPQLFNILCGDMYFVGPRPFVPNQEEECVRNIPFYAQRWSVKPGATGWAQVNRAYCATIEDNAEKLGYDLFYIKHMSAGLDLLVLFKTAKILLLGRGAR